MHRIPRTLAILTKYAMSKNGRRRERKRKGKKKSEVEENGKKIG